MVLSPVVVMDLRQVEFLRHTSSASEMFSVQQKLHVIAIPVERRRAAMRATHQLIAVLKLCQLKQSDRLYDQNYRHACMPSNSRSVHHLVHAIVVLMADDQGGVREHLAYQ